MPAGTWALIKLAIRRDRIKLSVWITGVVGMLLLMLPLLRNIYGSDDSLAVLYQTFGSNPAGLFLTGPMDGPNFESLFTLETLVWWGLAVALLNTFLVVRHTRHNEDIGAQEIILSAQTSRNASLMATLIVAFVVNLLVATAIGLGFMLIESTWSAGQAWLYGLALGSFGFVWAAVAAVVVQLFGSSRSANGALVLLVCAAFITRGVGDVLGSADAGGLNNPMWPSWISPFGWLQMTRPLTSPEFWPLLISISFTIVVISVAFWLLVKRDLGAGILPAHRGRARASDLLTGQFGLARYLQRGAFLGWLIGILAISVTVGALVPEMADLYRNSSDLNSIITSIGGQGDITNSFLSAMLTIIAVMVVAFSIQSIGVMRAEESAGHLDNVLATKVSRRRWLLTNVVLALVNSAFMLLLAGVVLGGVVQLVTGTDADTGSYIIAGLSYLPLISLFIAVYVLLFGLLPGLAGFITWVYYGFVAFVLWLGPILQLDQWIMDLSPLSHMSAPLLGGIDSLPLFIMVATSIALLTLGLVGWQRRDLYK